MAMHLSVRKMHGFPVDLTFHGHAFLGSGKENWRLGALLAVTSVGAVRGHQQRMEPGYALHAAGARCA